MNRPTQKANVSEDNDLVLSLSITEKGKMRWRRRLKAKKGKRKLLIVMKTYIQDTDGSGAPILYKTLDYK